jgi:flagellar protein FliJ
MTGSERFKPIQKIAEKKERDAATAFGKTLRDREAAQARLAELQQYHAEYLERFAQATQNGVCGATIQEYQAFIGKLEFAIEQQQQVLQDVQLRCDDSKAQWRGKFTKARAVDNAVDRMRAHEEKQREHKEQLASDERSQRRK